MGENKDDVQVVGDATVVANVDEGAKGVEVQQVQAVDDGKVAPSAATEAVEAEPKLTLTVDGTCNNPLGLFVGLSKTQRDKLGVDVGGYVELKRANGEIIGIYTVGMGSKTLLAKPGSFTANGVENGETVEVVNPRVTTGRLFKLPLAFGVEAGEKHQKRSAIIAERFGANGFDGQAYVVLPTGFAKVLTGQTGKALVASIALGRIKVGGEEKTMPIVPAGEQLGMTSSAAKSLGIPSTDLKNAEFYISEDGVLVINQVF